LTPLQVSGYVLLAFIDNVDVIPLTNLRVIRGNTLFRVPKDVTNVGYSLFVLSNYLRGKPDVGLKELQLTSLHGMSSVHHCFFVSFLFLCSSSCSKGKGTVLPLMEVFHGTATECHVPYGITQCYLLPDTSEHTPP